MQDIRTIFFTATLRGISGEEFKGFFVQARLDEDRDQRAGTFNVVNGDMQARCSNVCIIFSVLCSIVLQLIPYLLMAFLFYIIKAHFNMYLYVYSQN